MIGGEMSLQNIHALPPALLSHHIPPRSATAPRSTLWRYSVIQTTWMRIEKTVREP